MKDAQKPDHVSLDVLLGRLKEGRFVIPDFQREFEWKPADIRDLVRSICLDYYIGSLLLWRGKKENFEALACEPIYGYSSKDSHPEHIVLDGQQRLTAMYYAFVAPNVPVPSRANRYTYFIRVDRFAEEDYEAAFDYDWSQWATMMLKSTDYQFANHIFPLGVIGQGGWELPNWLQGYERHWADRARFAEQGGDDEGAAVANRHTANARAFSDHVRGITQQYQVSYIELDRDLEIDKVCDIFTQINSKGVRLDAFDLVNALLKPRGLQLKHMWREASQRLDFVDTDKMNVYILQVMSLLRQGTCSPRYLYFLLPGQERTVRDPDRTLRKEVLIPNVKAFESLWARSVDALATSITTLRHPQEFGAVSSQYLPYVSILPAFSALQHEARLLSPGLQLAARRKLSHWYWASVFTNRYSGAVESTATRDVADVKAWFEDDSAVPPLIGEFQNRFRNLELRREIKRGTAVYNGIFNLLVLRGARDWMTADLPQLGDLDDHHIVPKEWGKKHGLGAAIDTILNRTPLTADTNRKVIRERLPNMYLKEMMTQNSESSVRGVLESHFISPAAFDILLRDPFTPADFEAFLSERQRTILDAVEDLLIKERLDLAPALRDLDARIERVELRLRELLTVELANDPGRLNAAIVDKVRERIRSAARKNPGFDHDHYASLPGMLEYCDLRELQDLIVSKPEWPSFEPRFLTKQMVETRFNQLGELRNGIRHSRTVSELTRKDGEAALLWFEQALVP